MLKLASSDRRHLRMALTSGFRSYSALKIFVSDNFEFRLNEIAPSAATRDAADALIEYFEEEGTLETLILALNRERPKNPDVLALFARLQGFLQDRLLLEPDTAETSLLAFDLPDPYEDVQLEAFLPKPFSYETDVGKLRRGLQLADSVCKISFGDRPTTGTGVLIAPDLVLTNYHVLSREVVQEQSQLAEKVKTLRFEFGFVSEESDLPLPTRSLGVQANQPIVAYSPPSLLDYALLRVEPSITDEGFLKPISVSPESSRVAAQHGLNVLQHPAGNVMQVSLSASGVVQVNPDQGRVWYVNRTQGGSSGSPCFNSDWEMVALHHASMSRGFGSVREGILVSSIWAEISAFLA